MALARERVYRAVTGAAGAGAFGPLFRRDLLNLFLNPAWIMFNTVFPLLLVVVLSYLTKGNYGGMGVTSYDYYGVTLLLFSGLSTAMTSANGFMERHMTAANLRVLHGPVRPSWVYSSKIVATWIFSALCFGVVAGVLHIAFGVNFGGPRWGFVAVVVLLLSLLSSAVGVMACCLLRSEEAANKIVSPVTQLMAVVGGLFFPLDGISPTMARLSWFSPVKWVSEAVFRVIYDGDGSMFGPTVVVLLAGTAAAWTVCRIAFRTEDYV